jgi:pimeloyl-ACP methyl ester carboxylesterase
MKTMRFILAALIVGLLETRGASAQDLGNSIKVEELAFQVLLSSGPAKVVGYLYYHGSYQNRPLQVLVHGATYNHAYWDFETVKGEDYSYARYMAARHYAVLAIDLPGAGDSDKPFGPTLGLADTSAAVHQVVEAMRSGNNPAGHAFGPIVLVGHSAGSIASTAAQAGPEPVADALVITASRHLVGPVLELQVERGIVLLLQTLAGIFGTVEYFSLPPEYRTLLFYLPGAAEAAVIEADNLSADQWTNGQLGTTFGAFFNPAVDRVGEVKGPVFIQLSRHDALFPADFPEVEQGLWTSATVDMQTLVGIGHNFNLHHNRLESWQGIDAWIRQHVSKH